MRSPVARSSHYPLSFYFIYIFTSACERHMPTRPKKRISCLFIAYKDHKCYDRASFKLHLCMRRRSAALCINIYISSNWRALCCFNGPALSKWSIDPYRVPYIITWARGSKGAARNLSNFIVMERGGLTWIYAPCETHIRYLWKKRFVVLPLYMTIRWLNKEDCCYIAIADLGITIGKRKKENCTYSLYDSW